MQPVQSFSLLVAVLSICDGILMMAISAKK
jgi:hypothetical protein